jgi:hypothetical protein
MGIIPSNARIRSVQRAGAIGQYGPELRTVHVNLWCRLDNNSRLVKDGNGRSVTTDGNLILPARVQLLPDDVLTMDSAQGEQYTVFDVREERDILGAVQNRVYRLVRKAAPIPAP